VVKKMKNVLRFFSTAVIIIAMAGCGTTADTSEPGEVNTGSGNENSGIVEGSVVESDGREHRRSTSICIPAEK
jgi:hypothetical protein